MRRRRVWTHRDTKRKGVGKTEEKRDHKETGKGFEESEIEEEDVTIVFKA